MSKFSRRALLALGGALVATVLPLRPAGAQKPPAPARPERPTKADADADKLFDDLEADLAGKAESARVPVIVTLREAVSEGRIQALQDKVGAVTVGHRFGLVPAFSATLTKGQAHALARQPDVAHVEADSRVQATNDGAQRAFGVTAARAAVGGTRSGKSPLGHSCRAHYR